MASLVIIGNSVLCRENVLWEAKLRPLTRMLQEATTSVAKELISVQKFKGYEVRTELYDGDTYGCEDFEVKSAYSDTGIYVGDPAMAKQLIVKLGIRPQLADHSHSVASIGFQKEEAKWYGWSHRAICGFGVGDRIFDQHYRGDLSEKIRDRIPFIKHGDIKIITLDHAKLSAKNFGSYVS